jgi:hypothetical protein
MVYDRSWWSGPDKPRPGTRRARLGLPQVDPDWVLWHSLQKDIEHAAATARRNPSPPSRMSGEEAEYRAARSQLLVELNTLRVELRSQRFSAATLRTVFGTPPRPGSEREPLPGEKAVSLGFEIGSWLSLLNADVEAWGCKAVSEATRNSSEGFKAAVKVGQYLLGPSLLTPADDFTKIVGEAVEGINKQRLERCVDRVRTAVEALPSPTDSPQSTPTPVAERPRTQSVTPPPESPWLPEPPSSSHRYEGPSAPDLPGAF